MNDEKIVKERSALYPIITINECVEIIEAINRIGGKLVSVESVAKEIGMSTKTNAFKSKISTLKQFGFLSGTGTTLQLTDLSKQYLYPTNDRSKTEVLLKCFLTAPLYQKLTSRYENQAIPSKERLSNILLQEYKITKTAKDIAAEQFLQSAEQIGILKNGVIILEDEEPVSSESKSNNPVSKEPNNGFGGLDIFNMVSSPAKSILSSTPESDFITQSLPMASGKVAKLVIPNDADEDSLLLLKDMFDAILRRKFKIDLSDNGSSKQA